MIQNWECCAYFEENVFESDKMNEKSIDCMNVSMVPEKIRKYMKNIEQWTPCI